MEDTITTTNEVMFIYFLANIEATNRMQGCDDPTRDWDPGPKSGHTIGGQTT